MKAILISLIILVTSICPEERDPYGICFSSIAGKTIDMTSYKGKKIIIAVLSLSRSNIKEWYILDSLSRNDQDDLGVIAILARDIKPVSDSNLLSQNFLLDSLHISFPISGESNVTRLAANDQQPLIRWLTHNSENNHFNRDVEEDGQFFVISEMGDLFAVMKKKSLHDKPLMQKILDTNVLHIK